MDSVSSPQSFIFSDDYICQWDSCLKNFDDAEMLYEHLRDDHVGRKAHHNLCLTCRWDKCSVPTFAKRDHITSHLRVHVASKPYHCDICRKGFKRPQDLKKHEKTHQDGDGVVPTLGMPAHLQPNIDQNYQPLTPPSYLDRSPSIASSTLSAQSPYSMPLSPASMADSNEPWTNPGHSSPFPPHSDLFSTPDLVDNSNHQFARPTVDVSGAYYGVFPNPGYENMISPVSAKRSRDGFDEILTDTLGSFALEAKKKRLDPSYNEDMMGRLNALSAILEVNPLTPDRLLTSLPDVNDWNQFNQFNQFCSTLFEDVSGEVFQPQTFETLFPEQKQNPIALDANFAGVVPNYNPGLANNNMNYNNGGNFNGVGYPSTSVSSTEESIYSNLLPEDPFVVGATVPSVPYGTAGLPWEIPASGQVSRPGVVKAMPFQNSVHQATNPYQTQTHTMNTVRNSNISPRGNNISRTIKTEHEETFVPTVVVKVERTYADMSTQTKAKQEKLAAEAGGMMMMMSPQAEKKKTPRSAYEGMDPELVLLNAPAVPNAPLPEIETDDVEDEQDQDQDQETTAQSKESDSAHSSATHTSSSKFEGLIQKAKARQAAAAAAAAAASEPLDPLDAMTRQLAQTHLEEPQGKVIFHPPTTKPVTEGDMDRQIRAAKARALCSEDPVRKQHAEVVLGLLKSIDALMADHRQKVAEWTAQQHKQQAGGARRAHAPAPAPAPTVNGYPRQIRTVSSYLPRRTPHQPSPLHQDQTLSDPDYSQLRSSLNSNSNSISGNDHSSINCHSVTESAVLYPTSNLQVPVQDDDEPFELSEEERRFIEEDYAKTAAEKAAASGHPYIYA
ncbi:hypothetical protein BG015_009041 [Linnemannia schmuckeri]|uniref:C2H2-type domain-containing protein n=1 Tax=Linnemannia schmuckeri TaxID=64567 RepID=A0A9P5VA27_9FUNG|nr:hypothetical protein BG015_009041 [Linnemannia schmuckeri]